MTRWPPGCTARRHGQGRPIHRAAGVFVCRLRSWPGAATECLASLVLSPVFQARPTLGPNRSFLRWKVVSRGSNPAVPSLVPPYSGETQAFDWAFSAEESLLRALALGDPSEGRSCAV